MINPFKGKVSKNLREQLIHSNEDIDKILSVLGSVVMEEREQWGDDEEDFDMHYGFPESREGVTLSICNDDAWGPIIGAYVYDGHLILVAHYGDGGKYYYSLTCPRGELPDGTWINNIDINAITVMGLLANFDPQGA